MKPQEKATELIEKFGRKAIERVDYTLDIWNTKREIEISKLSESIGNDLIGLEICNRTINYWNTVKNIINNEQVIYRNC